MSYQVLARKWRPKNFEQLMGQDHVVNVLVNALAQDRLHHAYLLTGTRGVGKTTIARIFAKSLNCETGITAKPCGTCDTCVDIDQGRFVDLREIDAASKTGVADTREILDNVQYAPSRGRFKVYLIDEVHILSKSSFNALLKTLEEPPAHVKFILATTDPQKLPVTVLSRCLQFHLKALTVKQIEAKLSEILVQEEVVYEPGVLTLLAKAARGSMRDSLSLTDQAIAHGQGNIKLADIQQMLGGIDQNWVYKIVISLLKQDPAGLIALSQQIASYAPNYSRLFAELIQLFHQTALMQLVEQHFDLSLEHLALMKKFSKAMSPEDIQLYYQICLNGRKDLPYASDEQAAFDMTLIRLLAFKPMQVSDTLTSSTNNQNESITDKNRIDFSDDLSNLPSEQLPHTPVVKVATDTEASSNNNAMEKVLVDKAAPIDEIPASRSEERVFTPDLDETNAVQNTDTQTLQLAQEMASIEEEAASLAHSPVQSYQQEGNQQVIEQQATTPESVTQQPLATVQQAQNVQAVTNEVSNNQAADNLQNSPVSAVLATRNMLRSRKKQLESTEKKSSGAEARQTPSTNQTAKGITPNNVAKAVKAIEPAPEAPYQAEKVDPAIVKKANQVDKWAHMIDSMELTARIRQLAIHATIDENSTDYNLVLRLNQSTKHLYTDIAKQQLEQSLCEFLSKPITVTIEIVEKTIEDPYQIQSQIDDKRYDYAKTLLKEDAIVVSLQDKFQASLDESSISAL